MTNCFLYISILGLLMKKRLKVLINPFGGQGKAKQIFENKVRPIFDAAKCSVDVQCKKKEMGDMSKKGGWNGGGGNMIN
jgi:hypothetical protein